ncbi:orotidine-5'-phosphate decarboxylase [candidate division KSB1 bacterium]|nr:orotidine-5'-phosphate decarboxylase [candidate division KSB1 bacterium]
MNFTQKVKSICIRQHSLLCVGLDTDIARIPEFLRRETDAIFEFNKAIIDATCSFAAAYKPNLAFYEALGPAGWQALERTVQYIPEGILKIADAKRGDIGNTAKLYAKAFFDRFDFDAVTINPYLGTDAVLPFLEREDKGGFVLCLTSNPGSKDFQYLTDGQQTLYERVLEKVHSWNDRRNCGLVVGATHPDELKAIRAAAPGLPILIPGIGAQAGDVEASVRFGTDENGELALFNSSRGIIYKSGGKDFAEVAATEARRLRDQINKIRMSI